MLEKDISAGDRNVLAICTLWHQVSTSSRIFRQLGVLLRANPAEITTGIPGRRHLLRPSVSYSGIGRSIVQPFADSGDVGLPAGGDSFSSRVCCSGEYAVLVVDLDRGRVSGEVTPGVDSLDVVTHSTELERGGLTEPVLDA